MPENKKRLNIAIPMELYTKVTGMYGITEAIIKGLESILEPQKIEHDISQLNESSTDLLKSRIKELQEQLTAKDLQNETRIHDLQSHSEILVKEYQVQIQELWLQLHTKDEQMKDQNENMHKQAVHIQSLIQENSRLNTKLLPDNTENKKPWYKFW